MVNEDTIPYLRTWLSAKSDLDRTRLHRTYGGEANECQIKLANYLRKQDSVRYPLDLGKSEPMSKEEKLAFAFYFADKYLVNYESSHCQPLPKTHFQMPWNEKQLMSREYSF